MKSTIKIEIETPDKIDVFPEDGQSEEDFVGKTKRKELEDFRVDFIKEVHGVIIALIRGYIDERFEEEFFDSEPEVLVEGFEDFRDYGIVVRIVDEKKE